MGLSPLCDSSCQSKNEKNNKNNPVDQNYNNAENQINPLSSEYLQNNNSQIPNKNENNIINQSVVSRGENQNTIGINNSIQMSNNMNTPGLNNSSINPFDNTPSPRQSNIQNSGMRPQQMENSVELKVSSRINLNTSVIKSNPKFICTKTIEGHKDNISCIIELSSGCIASGSYDKTVEIWDLDSQTAMKSIPASGRVFCLLEFVPGILLIGTDTNNIEICNINESNSCEEKKFEGHKLWVNCLTKCDDNYFASGSNDSDIRIWNFYEKQPYNVLSDHEDNVFTLTTLKDGKLCSGSADLTIKIWDWEKGECISTLKGHTRWIKCVYQLLNGNIVSGGDDKTIKIWDQEKCLATLNGHAKSIRKICQI